MSQTKTKLHSALIITSIADAKHPVLKQFAKESKGHGYEFVVAGDTKSPQDFNLKGCTFLGIAHQEAMPTTLGALLPTKHYCRKNMAYLYAMQKGYANIKETDDDNVPYESFYKVEPADVKSTILHRDGWLNIYKQFTKENIWPRGLPLNEVHTVTPTQTTLGATTYCPIQQGLPDDDPDVDAIYRLCITKPIKFVKNKKYALAPGCWSPFNSQNTLWYKEAYMLMYLPAYCSFRMSDIWRSFVAQRIAYNFGWHILYTSPTVYQLRNEHDLMKDFEDEVPGYLHNNNIKKILDETTLRTNTTDIGKNLIVCYNALIKAGIMPKKEMPLVKAWVADVELALK
jgi:hypothetical protein